jgi:acetoacetyl-CoA synthetase
MYNFMKKAESQTGKPFKVRPSSVEAVSGSLHAPALTAWQDYGALYQWSIEHRSEFWRFTLDYFPVVYSGKVPNPVVDEAARIDTVPRWFQGLKLNFAENILFFGDEHGLATTSPGKEDDKIACTEVREGWHSTEAIRQVTWKELRQRVGRLSQAMKAHGIRRGDRVALVAGNSLDTLTVFLAVTALGGIFSSSSTDMGIKALLERLVQIEPKLIFMDDWAVYNGKRIDLRSKMRDLAQAIKHVRGFQGIIAQARFQDAPADVSSVPNCRTWNAFLSAAARSSTLEFEQVDFGDPMIIVYSSGTTGLPKAIVHSVGGVVLSGHKESTLHRQVDSTSTQLQYTTTGWMMYMSSVQLMLTGARLIMYDGSPFIPDVAALIRLVDEQDVTHLGVSPRYLQTLQMKNIRPRRIADLRHLQIVTSTGMVLSDALFQWFYDVGFPPSVQLCNISGGTDIAAAFGTANPLLPVYVGGCQCIALGMAVSVFDSSIEGGGGRRGVKGRSVPDGVPGELVCTEAFPTMPVKLWGADGQQQYFSSYFEKYDGCWTHGDFIMIHPLTKQVIYLGRADGVLNPSGVRFGSADIYGVIDTFFPETVADSICVGQRRPQDDDESVMLFLLMKPGKRFTAALVSEVKAVIRRELSPRHVPRYVFETPEIPVGFFEKRTEHAVPSENRETCSRRG